jgi:hypothetical protein
MINYPHKPQKLLAIEEIASQIHSAEYSAELLLMHVCAKYDELVKHIKNTPRPESGSAPYFSQSQWEYAKARFLNT